MAYNTYVAQGGFTSTGEAERLVLRGSVDWIETWNLTIIAAGGADTGAKFYWQKPMISGSAIEHIKTAATDALQISYLATLGFTPVDDGEDAILGALNATVTNISNAAPPAVLAASTAGLVGDGDVVRILNVPGAQQFGGIDFTIDTVVANTSFNLTFAPTIVDSGAVVAATFRRVNRQSSYYPRSRYVAAITQAANAVVECTVNHDYTAGEIVRLIVPASYGMVEMDGLLGEIIAVDLALSTITLDIDSTAFTALAWPLTAAALTTPAQVIPVGDAPDVLTGATRNIDEIGIELAAGAQGPAGVIGDIIKWKAGVSFSVTDD